VGILPWPSTTYKYTTTRGTQPESTIAAQEGIALEMEADSEKDFGVCPDGDLLDSEYYLGVGPIQYIGLSLPLREHRGKRRACSGGGPITKAYEGVTMHFDTDGTGDRMNLITPLSKVLGIPKGGSLNHQTSLQQGEN